MDGRMGWFQFLFMVPFIESNKDFTVGLEVPLTGPKNQSFTYSPIFWIVKVW